MMYRTKEKGCIRPQIGDLGPVDSYMNWCPVARDAAASSYQGLRSLNGCRCVSLSRAPLTGADTSDCDLGV